MLAASRARTSAVLFAMATAAIVSCNRSDVPQNPPATAETPTQAPPTQRVVGPLSQADAAVLATMNDRLKQYVELHRKIESQLPRVPDNATPQQIDTNQREFERRMREARKSAKQGDIFTPDAQAVIKRLLANVFAGPEGQQLKGSIFDENPVAVPVTVNARYPDAVPISTMPPQVLQALPELSDDIEYRFINDNLIILDAHAHVIADFIPDALPK
jgi:hypothetical protein